MSFGTLTTYFDGEIRRGFCSEVVELDGGDSLVNALDDLLCDLN